MPKILNPQVEYEDTVSALENSIRSVAELERELIKIQFSLAVEIKEQQRIIKDLDRLHPILFPKNGKQ